MRQPIVCTALLVLVCFALQPKPKTCPWRHGELVSVKQDVQDRNGDVIVYLYTVKGNDLIYLVALNAPLKLPVHSAVTFAIDKKMMFIQDQDGKERRVPIFDQFAISSGH